MTSELNTAYHNQDEIQLQDKKTTLKKFMWILYAVLLVFLIFTIVVSLNQRKILEFDQKEFNIMQNVVTNIFYTLFVTGFFVFMNKMINDISIQESINNTNYIYIILSLVGMFQILLLMKLSMSTSYINSHILQKRKSPILQQKNTENGEFYSLPNEMRMTTEKPSSQTLQFFQK
jgi:magnesium-transporting ATPase (P-type)